MFQPAGVRTLLSMRSSLPVRPRTALAKAAHASVGSASTEDLGLDKLRPPTAPPALGCRTTPLTSSEATLVPALAAEEEEEFEDDANEDPQFLLEKASTELYQFQNNWVEERRTEINTLWSQLEAEYGMALPQSECKLGASAEDAQDCQSLPSEETEVHASAAAMPDQSADDGLAQEADAVVDAAAQDLRAAQELRQRIEARLESEAALSASAGLKGSLPAGTEAHAVPREADAADASRLAALRQEVEDLRAKAAADPPARTASTQVVTEASIAVAPADRNLAALDAWMQDLCVWGTDLNDPRPLLDGCLRQPQGCLQGVSSPSRSRRCGASLETLASPARANTRGSGLRSCRSPKSPSSPSSSPSKKEMARLAEARAMEWAASKGGKSPGGGRSPSSGCRSPLSHGAPPAAAVTSTVAVGATRAAAPSRGPNTEVIDCAGTASPGDAALAVQRQLDEILGELDEIDRIHNDVCMLGQS